jgi:glycosyltransferase involved in cell wall biosynthesis
MMSSFASICVLSYERPDLLRACLESVRDAGAPFELIIHDDGSEDVDAKFLLTETIAKGGCSQLIRISPGHNEGVGEAVRKCFAVAQGDLLVKIDQDLVFTPGWLATTRTILEDPHVGAVGMFAYHHDPVDDAKMRIADGQRDGHYYVKDFVGSCFAVPRHIYEAPGIGPIEAHSPAFSEDVGLKDRIRKAGYGLALPDENLAVNVGFGVGPSTVNISHDEVRTIRTGPRVFDGTWS